MTRTTCIVSGSSTGRLKRPVLSVRVSAVSLIPILDNRIRTTSSPAAAFPVVPLTTRPLRSAEEAGRTPTSKVAKAKTNIFARAHAPQALTLATTAKFDLCLVKVGAFPSDLGSTFVYAAVVVRAVG